MVVPFVRNLQTLIFGKEVHASEMDFAALEKKDIFFIRNVTTYH